MVGRIKGYAAEAITVSTEPLSPIRGSFGAERRAAAVVDGRLAAGHSEKPTIIPITDRR
jgi:hypothetical protein